MTIHTMPQRSPEWYAIRLGHFTPSRRQFDTLMVKPRNGEWNDAQYKILYRIAYERKTGKTKEENWDTPSVARGRELEDEARSAYEMATGKEAVQVGFVERNEWIGCSPDGLPEDEYLEIKCPDGDTHMRYLHCPHELEVDYGWQIRGGMWIAERKRGSLVSYNTDFGPSEQLVIWGLDADDELAARLSARLDLAILKAKEIMGE